MFVENAWYVAALSSEIKADRPVRRQIMSMQVALFRISGRVVGLSAVCPHRGADLSRGTIRNGCVKCPLHGWEFGESGECRRIPSQPDTVKISTNAKVRKFPTIEQQGLIWIWMADIDPKVPPPHNELWEHNQEQRRVFDRPRLWKASLINAVENAIDISHTPFIHPGTLGPHQPEQITHHQIEYWPNARGFTGHEDPDSPWPSIHSDSTFSWSSLAAKILGVDDVLKTTYTYELGASVSFCGTYRNGKWDVLFAHVTPCDSDSTWFFGGSVRSRALNIAGDLFQRVFLAQLTNEDEHEVGAMLSNESDLSVPISSCVADRGTLAFRKVWSKALSEEQTSVR